MVSPLKAIVNYIGVIDWTERFLGVDTREFERNVNGVFVAES